MSFLNLFILAVGLSMDAFAVSVCKGLSLGRIKAKHMCTAGGWFGGFQALMPLIGYLLGISFAELVSDYAHWIAFALLVFIGASSLYSQLSGNEDDENGGDASLAPSKMLLLAIATSIDALAVGVTFAFFEIKILPAVLFIGAVTFTISAAGIKIGSIFGTKFKSKAQICGSVLLILLGIKIFLDGAGII